MRGWISTKSSTMCAMFVIGIVLVVLIEFLSWIILLAYPRFIQSILVRNGIISRMYPMNSTDEQIRRLYETNDPESYREMLVETWGGTLTRRYEPLVEHSEKPTVAKWVNVSKDGYRYIANQFALEKQKPRFTIFVFGGSTTFGYGVKDSESIPSALQGLLRDRYRMDAAVFNFGGGNYYSSTERIRSRTKPARSSTIR